MVGWEGMSGAWTRGPGLLGLGSDQMDVSDGEEDHFEVFEVFCGRVRAVETNGLLWVLRHQNRELVQIDIVAHWSELVPIFLHSHHMR